MMTEPTSTLTTGLVALAVALLGPLAGPYTLIVFAALAGSLWPLSQAETPSRRAGLWLMLRCAVTAIVLTGVVSAWVSRQWGWQPDETMGPVAFVIGLLGNGWRTVAESLASSLGGLLKKLGGGS